MISKFAFATKRAIHTSICVIGGGTAGSNVVAQLIKQNNIFTHTIRVFEPSKFHFYQPGYTVVGGFEKADQKVFQRTETMFNKRVPITPLKVEKVVPQNNTIYTQDGQAYTYDQLIIASGNELRYDQIKGAQEALENIDSPVTSVYTYHNAIKTQKIAKHFKGGKAIFTAPKMPIKCAGAPQKITFLLNDQWKKSNIQADIEYHTATPVCFAVKKYSDAFEKRHQELQNSVHLSSELVEVNSKNNFAVFQKPDGSQKQVPFDFLHLVPPQTPPQFIKHSGLANEAGYVDVHKNTLQHNAYPNIWSLGDSSSLPNSKTAAAVFSQTPVLVANLYTVFKEKSYELPASYDGYAACPIYVGGNKLILAEFLYDGVTDETFWSKQDQPSRFLYYLKRYGFNFAYWRLMTRGIWFGRNFVFKPTF